MICHYFQLPDLEIPQKSRLAQLLDGTLTSPSPRAAADGAPPAARMQTSTLTRLDLTPAQVEQLCAEHDTIDALLEAMHKRKSGSDPTHNNPIAAHTPSAAPRPASRTGSSKFPLGQLFVNTTGGEGQVLGSRRGSAGSGTGHHGTSTTVTVTREYGDSASAASRLVSSGRALSEGDEDGESTLHCLQDDNVQ